MSVIDTTALMRALALPSGESSDFDLNPGLQLPPGRVLRPAGVLIAVRTGPSGAELILTPATMVPSGPPCAKAGKRSVCPKTVSRFWELCRSMKPLPGFW